MNDADSERPARTCARENCAAPLPPRARRWCSRVCGRLAAAERRRAVRAEARQRQIEATKDRLTAAVERNYYTTAAAVEAGVSPATARRWEADDPELADRLDDARAGALDALASRTLLRDDAGDDIARIRSADLVHRTAAAVEARRGPGRARRARLAAAVAAADAADTMIEGLFGALDAAAVARVRAVMAADRARALEAARSGAEPGMPEAGAALVVELDRGRGLAAVP